MKIINYELVKKKMIQLEVLDRSIKDLTEYCVEPFKKGLTLEIKHGGSTIRVIAYINPITILQKEIQELKDERQRLKTEIEKL